MATVSDDDIREVEVTFNNPDGSEEDTKALVRRHFILQVVNATLANIDNNIQNNMYIVRFSYSDCTTGERHWHLRCIFVCDPDSQKKSVTQHTM